MNWFIIFALALVCFKCIRGEEPYKDETDVSARVAAWTLGSWSDSPEMDTASWSLQSRIPMTPEYDDSDESRKTKFGKFKVKKKLQKFLLPLLLAYKLKFFTLIPVLIGGLVLLTGATGLAGFFFALFAAVMGLKAGGNEHHH